MDGFLSGLAAANNLSLNTLDAYDIDWEPAVNDPALVSDYFLVVLLFF
jgi:hypothetical protein